MWDSAACVSKRLINGTAAQQSRAALSHFSARRRLATETTIKAN
jgi:hypothetical protein